MDVLVGGAFNAIHPGHRYFLEKAKSYGTLVVVIAHDVHNTKPYAKPAQERKALVDALHIADKVVIGDEKDYWKIVEKEKPSFILLGYDQELPQQEKGTPIIKKMNITIVRINRFGTFATKNMH